MGLVKIWLELGTQNDLVNENRGFWDEHDNGSQEDGRRPKKFEISQTTGDLYILILQRKEGVLSSEFCLLPPLVENRQKPKQGNSPQQDDSQGFWKVDKQESL